MLVRSVRDILNLRLLISRIKFFFFVMLPSAPNGYWRTVVNLSLYRSHDHEFYLLDI